MNLSVSQRAGHERCSREKGQKEEGIVPHTMWKNLGKINPLSFILISHKGIS